MKRSIAESEPSGSGKRVYFLGAGASKSICSFLPVARELTLRSLAERRSYSNDIQPADECEALRRFLDSSCDREKLGAQSLEDSLAKLRSDDNNHYKLALYCLAMRLSTWSCTLERLSGLAAWLREVRERRDTVITTNYDTLLERTLGLTGTDEWKPRDVPDRDALHWIDFGINHQRRHVFSYEDNWPTTAERSILLLKLHGSISWLFCEGCKTYCLDPIWQNAQDAWRGRARMIHARRARR